MQLTQITAIPTHVTPVGLQLLADVREIEIGDPALDALTPGEEEALCDAGQPFLYVLAVDVITLTDGAEADRCTVIALTDEDGFALISRAVSLRLQGKNLLGLRRLSRLIDQELRRRFQISKFNDLLD